MRIYVEGGTGGIGTCSFNRQNHSFRIPDGGNGGDGGPVIFRAEGKSQNLYDMKRAHFRGNNGKHGRGER